MVWIYAQPPTILSISACRAIGWIAAMPRLDLGWQVAGMSSLVEAVMPSQSDDQPEQQPEAHTFSDWNARIAFERRMDAIAEQQDSLAAGVTNAGFADEEVTDRDRLEGYWKRLTNVPRPPPKQCPVET